MELQVIDSRTLLTLCATVLSALAPLASPLVAQGYGSDVGWRLVFDHDEASGLAAGAQVYARQYSTLRLTWKRQVAVTGMASVRGGLGADLLLGQRFGRSRAAFAAQGTVNRRLDSYRFNGYGNDRPLIEGERSLVAFDERRIEGRVEISLPHSGSASIGAVTSRLDPHPDRHSPLVRSEALGASTFRQAGLLSTVDLPRVDDRVFPRRGAHLLARASAYWPALDVESWMGRLESDLRAYVPLPLGAALAGRALLQRVEGEAPVHEAAFIGGSESLRGYAPQRFAGDTGASGNAELRVPLLRIPVLLRGRLGGLAFADAGRVWVDGSSPGGWHRSSGGGLWYETSRATITVLYANGEEHLVHVYLGMPF
jgi:hypothetical protein